LWKGVSEIDIIRRLVGGDIPSSPKAANPDVDKELDRICRRALMFSPDERYPTAEAFQVDLERYLVSKGTRPSAREIGAYVAELFADKRATTDKIIGTQLAHLKTDSRVALAEMPPSSSAGTRSVSVTAPSMLGVDLPPKSLPRGGVTVVSAGSAAGPASSTPVSPTLRPVSAPSAGSPSSGSPSSGSPSSGRGALKAPPLPAAARQKQAPAHLAPVAQSEQKTDSAVRNPVLAALAALGVALVAPLRKLGEALQNGTRGLVPLIAVAVLLAGATAALTVYSFSPSRTALGATPVPVAAPRGKMITVTLRATPLEARFSIDEGPLQDNPFIGQFEGDGKDHVIRAVAPGFPPTQETVSFTNDVSMRFTLSATRKP
jgi:serine/threonine-protein kinase